MVRIYQVAPPLCWFVYACSCLNAQAAPQFAASGVVNAASYASGPIAPGELITIFGTTLGPARPVGLQLTPDLRSLSTAIGGVRVLFDGQPAPMIFASVSQVSAIVPYGVAARQSTVIEIEYNGVASQPVRTPVASLALGVFSMDSTGSGIGSILNQDGSFNGMANYASPGSVVVVYATGFGAMSNNPPDGSVAGIQSSFPLTPVTATVGGQRATVIYAGSAPGLVNGVLQVNIILPSQISAGTSKLVLTAGGSSSQSDLLIATPRRDPVPKGSRTLGIDLNVSEQTTYVEALAMCRSVGSGAVSLSLNWSDIESAPGKYHMDFLTAQAAVLKGTDISLSLRIRPVDTNGPHLPTDLSGKAFSDSEVIGRFIALMNAVFSTLQDTKLVGVGIGNEVDIAFGANELWWKDYKAFYDAVLRSLKPQYFNVRFGVPMSYEGLLVVAPLAAGLNENSDVVMVNDYPMSGNFIAKAPTAVRMDFDNITRLYPQRRIQFTEIGYPSSIVNGSSTDAQSQFVEEVFSAWDSYATQIDYLSFTWLTELPQSKVETFQSYYGITALGFGEFLRTLGLRTYPGVGADKSAFTKLKVQAQQRGW